MQADSVYEAAPELPLSKTPHYSVEYPGYIRDNPESIEKAVVTLGGASQLDASIRSSLRRTSSKDGTPLVPVELRLQPGNPYAHPVPGEAVVTTNLVLKVTTRRKSKRKDAIDVDGVNAQYEPKPEFKAEIVGVVPRTLRFRSMLYVGSAFEV